MAQGVWVTNTLGGHLSSPKLSKQMRAQASPFYVFRQFTELKDEDGASYGKNKGDTIVFNKRLRIDTRGGTLVETSTFPRGTIKVLKDSVVVTEYGNGADFTGKLESLAEFNIRDQYAAGLVDDQKDSLDRAVCSQFQLAKIKAVASLTTTTVFTSNGTATVTASADPADSTIRDIVDEMRKKKIPKYKMGQYYMGILSIAALRGVYNFLQAVAQYADPEFRQNYEVGQYYNCRMMEENNVLSNLIGLSSIRGEGIFFGDDAVAEAVAVPEELRYQETDMGRSKTLGWYAILGFKKVWDLVSDNLNSDVNGLERIIHLTSA